MAGDSGVLSDTSPNEAASRPGYTKDVAIVVIATLLFAASLALRKHLNVWLTIGGSSLLLILTAAYGRRNLPLWGPRGKSFSLMVGIGSGFALAGVTYALYPLALSILPSIEGEVHALYGDLRDWPGPVHGLPLLLLAVVAEELVWRGVLMRRLQWRKPLAAVLIATVAYAVPQAFSGSWVLVAVALGCGLLWTAERAWVGGIVAPMLTHATWNAFVFVLYPLG